MALFDYITNPFESVIDIFEELTSEEFWARIFRIVFGSILIIIALLSSIKQPVLWRR